MKIPKVTRSMVWTRGALYVGLAVLQKLYEILTSDAPIHWGVTIVSLLLAGGLTLRAYLDSSPANHKQGELDDAEQDREESELNALAQESLEREARATRAQTKDQGNSKDE